MENQREHQAEVAEQEAQEVASILDTPGAGPAATSEEKRKKVNELDAVNSLSGVLKDLPTMRRLLRARIDEMDRAAGVVATTEAAPDRRSRRIVDLLVTARARQIGKAKPGEKPLDALLELLDTMRESERRELVSAVTAAALDQPARQTGPRFTLEKAASDFRPVAKWLLATTFRERLCAIVVQSLLQGEDQLGETGCYESRSAGNDLLRDWETEVSAVVADLPESLPEDPETAITASYIMGMETGEY